MQKQSLRYTSNPGGTHIGTFYRRSFWRVSPSKNDRPCGRIQLPRACRTSWLPNSMDRSSVSLPSARVGTKALHLLPSRFGLFICLSAAGQRATVASCGWHLEKSPSCEAHAVSAYGSSQTTNVPSNSTYRPDSCQKQTRSNHLGLVADKSMRFAISIDLTANALNPSPFTAGRCAGDHHFGNINSNFPCHDIYFSLSHKRRP